MGSTYHSLHYHAVFSTKDRRPLIHPRWRHELHEYLGGTLRGLGAVAQSVGGVQDHVHLLFGLGTTTPPAAILREVKKSTNIWAREHHEPFFTWQEGYAVFTVSWTHIGVVRRYIEAQEQHHGNVAYTDELKRLLKRNGIDYDPRYLE